MERYKAEKEILKEIEIEETKVSTLTFCYYVTFIENSRTYNAIKIIGKHEQ